MDNKNWVKHYDTGVPAEVNLDEYQSLAEYLEINFKKFAARPAFANLGYQLSYAQIEQKSRDFAAFLQCKLKLKKGDRFAIMLPNLLQYVIAMFAALRVGLVVVNVNPLYTTRELTHQLKDSGAKALLVLANFANVAQTALPKTEVEHVIVTEIGDAFSPFKAILVNCIVRYIKKMVPKWHIPNAYFFRQVLDKGAKLNFMPVESHLDDIAYLQYTGGTTGLAKGAILTHGNMLANVKQLHVMIKPFLNSDKPELIVTALPLYHIFSLTVSCWVLLQDGANNILITNPRDIGNFIKQLSKLEFTTMIGVNTLFNALLNHPNFNKIDFSHYRFGLSGGMALQRTVSERWKKVTGVNLIEGYGLTEASPVVSAPPISTDYYTGSIGLPLPSTECAIMDDDGELPLGKEGELCVRGPQVMQGYWQKSEATDKVITRDGWLKTGDVARQDENGYFYLVDRKKNMIVVSGFNVYPTEIEEIVSQLSGVNEVAAVGVADDKTGERVKLFIVKKDDNLTVEAVKQFCYERLTRYKVPKEIEFRDKLPKSNVGKILHRQLRDDEQQKLRVANG